MSCAGVKRGREKPAMPAELKYWDEGPTSTWDSGSWDSNVAAIVDNIMNAQIALNLTHLKPGERMAKFNTRIAKCGETPALTTPNPTLLDCQAAHDAAVSAISDVDKAEQALVNLRI